jgi:arginine decarboxylase
MKNKPLGLLNAVVEQNSASQIASVSKHQQGFYLPSGFTIGTRIPKDFFETSGVGESDITIHAGSYHLALKDAGIEMCNIMTYSSILPGIARRTGMPDQIPHGCVMESIMSASHARKGELATAGIIYAWLYDKMNRTKFGGLVCEHNGNYSVHRLEKLLKASLEELYWNGFSSKYDLGRPRILKKSFIPQKEYGTALVSLCFNTYYLPVIQS